MRNQASGMETRWGSREGAAPGWEGELAVAMVFGVVAARLLSS